MKRLGLIVVLVAFGVSSPIVLHAQRGGGARGGGHAGGRGMHTRPPAPPPRTATEGLSIDHPLPGNLNTVKPAPVPGFGPPPPAPFAARPGTYTRTPRRAGAYGASIGYDYGFSDPVYGGTYSPRDLEPPAIDQDTGLLFLDVTPATALVFADTAFVGSVEDLRARGLRLPARNHRVDLEATGYETKTIEVAIRPGEPLRYRVDLSAVRSAAVIVMPPHAPETMYAIPGCYGGNRPPVAANLPAGCDIARVRVIRPQPRPN